MGRNRTSRQRRALCVGLVALGALAACPLPSALAGPNGETRIIVLESMTLPAVQARTEALRKHLQAFGYREGVNLQLLVLNAEKKRDKARTMLRAAIERGRPDLVISIATLGSQEAHTVLRDTGIPQVFFFVSDPIGAGLIPAIGMPSGSNVAGFVHLLPRDVHLEMAMRLAKQATPNRPVRLGLLYTTYPSSTGMKKHLSHFADTRGDVKLHAFEIEELPIPEGLPDMIARAREGMAALAGDVDFLWIGEGPLGRNVAFQDAILAEAPKPVLMGPNMAAAKAGVLAALDSDPDADAREAARLANAVINGADPSRVPVMRNQVFRMGLNAGTARRLGIAIPPDMIKLAGEHIYQ